MGKETKRRLFIVLTAVLLMLSAVAGIMFGYNSVQAETTGVFTATGGSYQLGTRADKTVDGLPLTITPTVSGNDVKLEYNGVYRRAANPSGSFWAYRQLTYLNGGVDGAVPDAKALIFTCKAINDESKSFSFVMTKDAMYFSLISDISFDDNGLPYVTGTEQYLQKTPTNNVGFSTRKALALYVSNDADGSVYVADNTVMLKLSNEAWLANSSANLSGKQKEMYGPARALSLSRDEDLRCCKWEFTAVELQSEATILLRHFDGNNYYNGGTNYLEIQKPGPAIYTNHNALIKSNGTSYALTDLYNTEYVTSTTGNYIQGFTTTDTTALTTSGEITYLDWGKGTWTKTNFTHGASKVYTVMQLISGASDAMPHSPYYYGAFDVVERANEVITQKADKLISGEKYKASELFKNLSTLNKCDSNLELLISTEENGTYSSIGTLDGDYEYTAGAGESVTFYVKVKDTELAAKGKPCETAASAFSFVVKEYKPKVTFKGLKQSAIYGENIDLSSAFEIEAKAGFTVKYYVGEKALESSIFRPLAPGDYSVKCVVVHNSNIYSDEGIIVVSSGNEFIAEGGSYILGVKEDISTDGLPLTVIPNGAGSDVLLTFNGAFRRGVSEESSGWGSRLIVNFKHVSEQGIIKAQAVKISYISPTDPTKSLTYVLTQSGAYFSLIDEISFDEFGEPYVTGTSQYLVKSADTLIGGQTGYYIKYTGEVYKQDGNVLLVNITDETWRKSSSKDLPEELQNRYSEEYVQSVLTDKNLINSCILRMHFIGLKEEHTIGLRSFNGTYYFSGQANLKMKTAEPLVVAKHNALIKSATLKYKLSDIFDVLCFDKTQVDYIQGFYNSEKWGDGVWTRTDVPVNGDEVRFVVQALAKSGSEMANGSYAYGKITTIENANQVIKAKDIKLKVGRNYRISELFENLGLLNTNENLSISGFFEQSSEGANIREYGTLSDETTFEFSHSYATLNFHVKVKDKMMQGYGNVPYETEYSIFTFEVDLSKPEIGKASRNVIVGIEYSFSELFDIEYYGTATIKYYLDGQEYLIPSWIATAGEHTVKCSVTDSRGFSNEFSYAFKSFEVKVKENNVIETEKDTAYVFPVLILPDPDLSYSVALYRYGEEYGTPLSVSDKFVFIESGKYVLIYKTVLGKEEKTFTTIYDVTVIEKKANIRMQSEYKETYYTGTVLDIIPVIAERNGSSVSVTVKASVNGTEIAVGKVLKLDNAGLYKIKYIADEGAKNEASLVIEFKVIIDDEKPSIILAGEYKSEYEVGTQVQVLKAIVNDNSGADIDASVVVYENGKELKIVDDSITVKKGKKYKVVYTAMDNAGLTEVSEYEFIGKGTSSGCESCDGSIDASFYTLPLLAVGLILAMIFKKRRNNR